MAGKKQPIDLVIAKGKKHLTKDEIENRRASEVKAPSDKIESPAYLTDNLKEEFFRLRDELMAINVMTNLDSEALARFIVSENQYQKVTTKILSLKTIGKKYFELMSLQKELFKMARAAASDLGLTISSRCKLVVPKKEEQKPESKFSKFGAGGNAR